MNRRTIQGLIAAVALLAATGMASAVPGFNVVIQAEGGLVGGGIDDVNEGEVVLAGGGAPEGSGIFNVINFLGEGGNGGSIGGDVAFPAGTPANQFALNATGFVTGVGGPTVFNFGVNSDDGFRVRLNGVTIGEHVGVRGPGDTLFSASIKDNDQFRVIFFEAGGGDEVEFFVVGAGGVRTLVGAPGSGIGISNVSIIPEPATMSLLALSGLALLRRRRQA